MSNEIDTIMFSLFVTLIMKPTLRKNLINLLISGMGNININLEKHHLLTTKYETFKEYTQDRFKKKIQDNLLLEFEKEINKTEYFDGTEKYLESLKSQDYRMIIVDDIPYPYKEIINSLGLEKLVNGVILSCEEGVTKSKGELYNAAFDKFNINPHNCVVVGEDYQLDHILPKKLGTSSIQINRKTAVKSYQIGKLSQLVSKIKTL